MHDDVGTGVFVAPLANCRRPFCMAAAASIRTELRREAATPSIEAGEPNGCTACFNDAPCPPFTSHGAPIRQLFGAGLFTSREPSTPWCVLGHFHTVPKHFTHPPQSTPVYTPTDTHPKHVCEHTYPF
jgi:hypothetical protein